jgi:hypothetical protein
VGEFTLRHPAHYDVAGPRATRQLGGHEVSEPIGQDRAGGDGEKAGEHKSCETLAKR